MWLRSEKSSGTSVPSTSLAKAREVANWIRYLAPVTTAPSLADIARQLYEWLEGLQKVGFVLGMVLSAAGFIVMAFGRRSGGERGAIMMRVGEDMVWMGVLIAIGVFAVPAFISLVASKFFGYSYTP